MNADAIASLSSRLSVLNPGGSAVNGTSDHPEASTSAASPSVESTVVESVPATVEEEEEAPQGKCYTNNIRTLDPLLSHKLILLCSVCVVSALLESLSHEVQVSGPEYDQCL